MADNENSGQGTGEMHASKEVAGINPAEAAARRRPTVEECLLSVAGLADSAKWRMEKSVSDIRRLVPVIGKKLGELEAVAGMKYAPGETGAGAGEAPREETGKPAASAPFTYASASDPGPVGDIVSDMADFLSLALSSFEEDMENVVGAKSRMGELYERIARLMDITESKLPPEAAENDIKDKYKDEHGESEHTTTSGSDNGEGGNPEESGNNRKAVKKKCAEDELPALPPGFKHSGGRCGGRPSLDIVHLYRHFASANETDGKLGDYLYATRSFQAFVEKSLGKPWEVLTPKERESLARKLLREVERKEKSPAEELQEEPQQGADETKEAR